MSGCSLNKNVTCSGAIFCHCYSLLSHSFNNPIYICKEIVGRYAMTWVIKSSSWKSYILHNFLTCYSNLHIIIWRTIEVQDGWVAGL
jgi:hypothetical protein